jgi:UDPglucose 6-dehydrogenase/GDP-mannose 6-dehydrogenase
MKISIIGTGYVGLVTGVCLADRGHHVICVDNNLEKIELIKKGIPPIYEVGLDEILKKNIGSHLHVSDNLEEAVLNTDVTMIAVGTPFDGKHIDLSSVKFATENIAKALAKKATYHTVIVKSTVIPRTTIDFILPILEEHSGKKAGRDFGLGMNPEFLREGEALEDFMFPDRLVLGGINKKTHQVLSEIYVSFSDVPNVYTDTTTAELIKYTSNSLLATLISFSNEIANLSEKIGVDVTDVLNGVHLDKRFMPILEDGTRIKPGLISYLWGGCGFGGSCFPKDVSALIAFGNQQDVPMKILESVMSVNKLQPKKMIEILKSYFKSLTGLNVGILGVAFKSGTDDLRESPSMIVCDLLINQGSSLHLYDPVAANEAKKLLGDQTIVIDTIEAMIEKVNVLLLMTSWPELKILPSLLAKMKNPPLLIDGRRMISKNDVKNYAGIGMRNQIYSDKTYG